MKKLSLASLTIFFMPAILPLADSLLNLHLRHFDSYNHVSLGAYKGVKAKLMVRSQSYATRPKELLRLAPVGSGL